MIILKKISSETDLFEPVEFHIGINLIKGEYQTGRKERGELNGIGKSTLVRLIDFALISDGGKDYFDPKKYDFLEGESVTLEIEIDGNNYFLKRYFDEPKFPRFGKKVAKLNEYRENDLKQVLGDLFFGKEKYDGIFNPRWFRTLIKFFIKDDLVTYTRDDPLKFYYISAKNIEAFYYNLFLLNLPNKYLYDFQQLNDDRYKLRQQKNTFINTLKENTGKKYEQVNSELQLIKEKVLLLEKSLSEYKFLRTYEDVEKRLILLAREISEKLKKLTSLTRRLDEFKRSYELETEIDKDYIVQMYSEANEIFGKVIERSLDEVLSFRLTLAKNRQIFLAKREYELSKEIKKIKKEISSFERERSEMLNILDEKNALNGLKNSMIYLYDHKSKQEMLEGAISEIEKLNDQINEINIKIPKTISKLSSEINLVKKKINDITSLFLEIIKKTTSVTTLNEVFFDINTTSNLKSPLKISIGIPKTEALGKSRFKILAYDLTVFLHNILRNRKFPYFLIHDGVFHAIDYSTVIRTLNYINSKFLQHQNFQYIFTANENEVAIPPNKEDIYGKYNFDLDTNICVTYKDIPEFMIFKREY